MIRAVKKRPLRVEFSAGGIIYRRAPAGPEVAFILDSYKKWTFPKGRIQRGENIERAAMRESQEELGLKKLKIVRRVGRINIWFVDRFEHQGALTHKYIYYVLLQAPPGAKLKKPPRPTHGEIIRAVKWVPLSEVPQVSSYKDIQPIIRKVMQHLKRG